VGVFNSLGWAAYSASNGDLLIVFIEPDPSGSYAYTDMGSNFETFTKADFQELETLGPVAKIAPGSFASHEHRWVIFKSVNLPNSDKELFEVLPSLVEKAKGIVSQAFH
jgi:hypothetical protein